MSVPLLKKSFFVSLCGHLALFGIFSFSFGPALRRANYPSINSTGALLSSYDLSRKLIQQSVNDKILSQSAIVSAKKIPGNQALPAGYAKPASKLAISRDKAVFLMPRVGKFILKKKPAIMFYPRLPNYFSVYFQDRQKVHIELLFNIVAASPENTLTVKRSISSGNLEVDLLSMRYISNYLFIQKSSFPTNGWQPIKIDLSFNNNDSY